MQSLRASEDTGLIGAKLAIMEKKHDLFTVFHLARLSREAQPDHRILVTFKPTGEAFRQLVSLVVTTDENGVIERVRLEVARSFIDDAQQGVFAADLVTSFLASVRDAAATDSIMALANEIHARSMINPGRMVLTAQPTPAVPKRPSAAYQTYAGTGPAQTLSNQSGSEQATLQNEDMDGVSKLELTLSSAGR